MPQKCVLREMTGFPSLVYPVATVNTGYKLNNQSQSGISPFTKIDKQKPILHYVRHDSLLYGARKQNGWTNTNRWTNMECYKNQRCCIQSFVFYQPTWESFQKITLNHIVKGFNWWVKYCNLPAGKPQVLNSSCGGLNWFKTTKQIKAAVVTEVKETIRVQTKWESIQCILYITFRQQQ